MLEIIKSELRIKTNQFDNEIKNIIDACKLDLKLAGVLNIDEQNPLIIRAVALYAKSEFGFNEDSDKFKKSYVYLKCSLALAGDYNL